MPRTQLLATVAAVAVAAAAAVVAVTVATRQTPGPIRPQNGKPPVAKTLDTPAAAAIHQAFANWPHGSIAAMLKLQLAYPKDPVVQFYVGLAYAWAGYDSAAEAPLEKAKKLGRDTSVEVNADTLLNPDDFPGDPTFQLSPGADATLRRGVLLEHDGHRESAERAFAADARAHPTDPQALAAAAFGLFDKDNPARAFGRLGPLTARFPRSQSIHFNLGLLLVWTGQEQPAVTQFRETLRLGSKTAFGVAAERFLKAIAQAGTASAAK